MAVLKHACQFFDILPIKCPLNLDGFVTALSNRGAIPFGFQGEAIKSMKLLHACDSLSCYVRCVSKRLPHLCS